MSSRFHLRAQHLAAICVLSYCFPAPFANAGPSAQHHGTLESEAAEMTSR